MAACEVRAELKYRDGTSKEFLQRCEKNLQSVLAAVRAVGMEVSALLTELVSQERATAAAAAVFENTEPDANYNTQYK
uniref:Si:dkeyp-55f12.3 n=1 Tax=Scleropages formosus TaxID=113540 RepID=A0A8C9RWP6_SCLFO